MADIGHEVAAHFVEAKSFGTVLRQQQDVTGTEPGRPHAKAHARVAERPTGEHEVFRNRFTGAAHPAGQVHQFGMHQLLVPDQAQGESAGAGLDHVIRRVEHNAGGFKGVENLVDAVGHGGVHHLGGTTPMAFGDVQQRHEACTDTESECQRQQYQPRRFHWYRLLKVVDRGSQQTCAATCTLESVQVRSTYC